MAANVSPRPGSRPCGDARPVLPLIAPGPVHSLTFHLSLLLLLFSLSSRAAQARIGGKGSIRRKVKTVHKAASMDDKRLQGTLKRLGVSNIPGIEEVRAVESAAALPIFFGCAISTAV
jgi:hypothetical protein